jgi:hypothetical protein
MGTKWPTLRRRRVRPPREAILEARGKRRLRMLFFQASLVLMLAGVVLLACEMRATIEISTTLWIGLFVLVVGWGLIAGRRYRVAYLLIGTGAALPGALVWPFRFVAASAYAIAILGYAWHAVTNPPEVREIDAPIPGASVKPERDLPWKRDAKPVEPARLLPKMERIGHPR